MNTSAITTVLKDILPVGMMQQVWFRGAPRAAWLYTMRSSRSHNSDPQVLALRRYLENGGFLMIDDSWGEEEETNVLSQMRRVFPNHAAKELPSDHKIFHCVFDLNEKPQVCSLFYALNGRAAGVTWERPDAKNVSYQGITNDSGRLMVLICHNTDLADGWERVDDDAWYA